MITLYYIYDVKIACPGNEKWTGETYSAIYVSVPKKADTQSLGIYVKFMGAGVRSTETHLTRKEDYICVAVNGHSIPSGMGADYYSNLYENSLKGYAVNNVPDDPGEAYYSYMVMRDLQALRWVKSYFGSRGEDLWDGERLEVSGMSEGGFQALFTAALDKDVSYCTADVPAICDKQGINIGRKSSYGSTLPAMLYYDTCFFARRIECPTKIMVGLGDMTCVPSGITAMYNELNCEKEIVYVQICLDCILPAEFLVVTCSQSYRCRKGEFCSADRLDRTEDIRNAGSNLEVGELRHEEDVCCNRSI